MSHTDGSDLASIDPNDTLSPSNPQDTNPNPPSSRPMTLRQQLDPILKAVYGCGRNSKVKMSDPTELDVWMTVDQAKDRIETLCQEIAREAVRADRQAHRCPQPGVTKSINSVPSLVERATDAINAPDMTPSEIQTILSDAYEMAAMPPTMYSELDPTAYIAFEDKVIGLAVERYKAKYGDANPQGELTQKPPQPPQGDSEKPS